MWKRLPLKTPINKVDWVTASCCSSLFSLSQNVQCFILLFDWFSEFTAELSHTWPVLLPDRKYAFPQLTFWLVANDISYGSVSFKSLCLYITAPSHTFSLRGLSEAVSHVSEPAGYEDLDDGTCTSNAGRRLHNTEVRKKQVTVIMES